MLNPNWDAVVRSTLMYRHVYTEELYKRCMVAVSLIKNPTEKQVIKIIDTLETEERRRINAEKRHKL
jgi:hypothetical protein